jgi:hypothetical protein
VQILEKIKTDLPINNIFVFLISDFNLRPTLNLYHKNLVFETGSNARVLKFSGNDKWQSIVKMTDSILMINKLENDPPNAAWIPKILSHIAAKEVDPMIIDNKIMKATNFELAPLIVYILTNPDQFKK